MKTVKKAVAAVLRTREGADELLVFRHPLAGVQIPKGTVESCETIYAAALRELEEESGLSLDTTPQLVGIWNRTVRGGQNEDGPLEINAWHITILRPNKELPDRWTHQATGSPAEDGLTFEYFWLLVDDALDDHLHPLFAETVRLIRSCPAS